MRGCEILLDRNRFHLCQDSAAPHPPLSGHLLPDKSGRRMDMPTLPYFTFAGKYFASQSFITLCTRTLSSANMK